jgi:hypothetical protein
MGQAHSVSDLAKVAHLYVQGSPYFEKQEEEAAVNPFEFRATVEEQHGALIPKQHLRADGDANFAVKLEAGRISISSRDTAATLLTIDFGNVRHALLLYSSSRW